MINWGESLFVAGGINNTTPPPAYIKPWHAPACSSRRPMLPAPMLSVARRAWARVSTSRPTSSIPLEQG
ncbi:hypothetical protein ACPA9J_17915 [Pseudomonas aeruginosa]